MYVEDEEKEDEPVIQKFNTQDEAKEYYKSIAGGRGPNKIKPNEDGYYEATI